MSKFKTTLVVLFILAFALLMDGSTLSLYDIRFTNPATYNLIEFYYLATGVFFDLVLAVFLLILARLVLFNSEQDMGSSIFLGATGAVFSFLLLLVISTHSFVDFSVPLADTTFLSKMIVELYIAGSRSYVTISAMIIFGFGVINFFRNAVLRTKYSDRINFAIAGLAVFTLSIALPFDIIATSYKLSTFPLVFGGILMGTLVTACLLLIGWLTLSPLSKNMLLSLSLIFVSGGFAFVLPFTIGVLPSPWGMFGAQFMRAIITPLRVSGAHSYLTISAVFIFCIGIVNLFRKDRTSSNQNLAEMDKVSV